MWLLLAIVGVVFLSIPALWIVVLLRRDGETELAARLARLEARVAELQRADAARPAPPSTAPPAPSVQTAPEPALAKPVDPPPSAVPAASAPLAASAAAAATPSRERIEELIMRRWAAWLGGLALALGGIFLVKYSIEQGYLGPAARVTAGLLLGLVLLAASEAARRKPLAAPLGPVPVDYVPAALAAAAVAVLFASLYVAYAVYDLISAGLAFPLLAGVSFGGAALSLVHGPFLALLGLAGAYVVPLLVSTHEPSVPRLLAYVLVVTAGCLFLVRWRQWPWLGWSAVAGSGMWTVLALVAGTPSDEIWIGLFLVLLGPLFPAAAGETERAHTHQAVVWVGAAVSALLMLAFAGTADSDSTSIGSAWVLTLVYGAIALKWPRFDRLAWIAAALQVLILADWHFQTLPFGAIERFAALPPKDALGGYLMAAASVTALAGIGGFVVLARVPQPQRWAALSALTPLAVLAILYWRVEQLAASLPWAVLAFILAASFLAASEYVAARRSLPGYTNALAYYALAVTGALALALTLSLRFGWLSVALSLELPAIAWLHERTGVRVLRHAAFVLAAVVLVRLLLNPAVADYDLGRWPIANALLYIYGVPALAFAATAYWLGRGPRDNTVLLLEAGGLALAMALITLEIRHLVGGRIDNEHYGLLEQALQSDAWLAVGYALLLRAGAGASPVLIYGWRIIAGVGAANLALGVCLADNPLLVPERVGDLPILDVLLLAYAVPSGLGVLYARALASRGFDRLARGAGIAGLALAFLYLSLETRHMFHGSRLDHGAASDGEWYAYSAVWLAFAAALLAGGIARGLSTLRFAGLVIAAIVAVKAFLFDMAALTGLYRAASFLGLGGSLVALAWLYQRVAATARAAPR
jgi:uncharacterized membrane protein